MQSRTFVKLVMVSAVFVNLCICSSVLAFEWEPNQSWQMFDSEYRTYNYAPSSIISEDGTVESHFYCSNKDAGQVYDHIYLRQRINGVWQPKTLVLSPSATGWDLEHTCDPSVIKGEFNYNGTTYQWAMFYLGCDVTTCKHNQIGVAFANNLTGPWVKWDGNPIIPFTSYSWWGVGQQSATSIDGAGRMLLFYTRGDYGGTRMLRQELDLSDMSSPVIGNAVRLPEAGLTSRDGSKAIFHNANLVYDPDRDKFFVSRPTHPVGPPDLPFCEQLQIACIDGDYIWAGFGSWDVLGHIDSSQSGFPRNHNCGIMRTPYGYLPDFDSIRVIFAVSQESPDWLWTHRLHSIKGNLVSFDIAGNDGEIDFADFSAWSQYWGNTNCEPDVSGYYADYNFDGQVDIADLDIFTENWLTDCGVENTNLVAWYKLDSNLGTTAVDSSGNGRDGTIYDAVWTDGRSGLSSDYGLNFRGLQADADYVHCGTFSPTQLGITEQMTVAFWVKWDGGNGRYQSFVAKRVNWDQNDFVWHVGTDTYATSLYFWTGDGNSVNLGSMPTEDQWVHVAIILDGSVLEIYYDGQLVKEAPYSLGSGTTDTPVRIGSTNNYDGLNAVMDDVRFYGYALSQNEIVEIMTLYAESYYKLNSGYGTSTEVYGVRAFSVPIALLKQPFFILTMNRSI